MEKLNRIGGWILIGLGIIWFIGRTIKFPIFSLNNTLFNSIIFILYIISGYLLIKEGRER